MTALPDPRKKLVRLIHVARRDLNMDEDTYRAILHKATGKASTSDMTIPELEKTLEHFKRCGFKIRHARKNKHGKAVRSIPLAQDPDAKKIRALWLFLHDLGLVRNASENALAAYVKRITRVNALQWIDGEQAKIVIESLKKWAMRVLPEQVNMMAKKLKTALHSGELALSQTDLDSLNHCYLRARQFPSFEPMQDAWYALRPYMEKVTE